MKIAWLSDFDPIGSGYQNISTTLCEGLVGSGNEVKAIGLHYSGQEHDFPFSIIPAAGLREAFIILVNLRNLWGFDVLVVALDIHLHNIILENLQQFKNFPYVGIMPVEADPLCTSWAMILLQMDLPLIISEFGTEEAHKANVLSAKHIPLGVDPLWSPISAEEKKKYRSGLFGVSDDDTFIVLTVADNQERKNLSAGLEAYKKFALEVPNSKYVLVTREGNPVGWSLRDLVFEYGLQNNVIIMERGMPKENLRQVYGSSDCFFLPSKAEGLGLPLMEAMRMRLPCIATDCTGMKELLSDGRGILVNPEYTHRDPFGNGKRYWISIENAATMLYKVCKGNTPDIDAAEHYVRERTWDKTILFLNDELMNLVRTMNNG